MTKKIEYGILKKIESLSFKRGRDCFFISRYCEENKRRDSKMKLLSNRLDFFTESIIRKMTRIANEYDAINLSQGFPDFDPPQVLIDSLIECYIYSRWN